MRPRINPSYLFLSRHGIYYFRCRIPLEVKKQYSISKNEVRKSLRTSNYTEALRKARKLWVEMAHYKDIDEMYADIERHDEMLLKGRELWNELQLIRKKYNFIQRDESDFIQSLRSEYEFNCLQLAINTFGNKPSSPAPSTTNQNLTELHSKIDDIKKTVSDDGLKKISISEATKKYYYKYIQDREEDKDKVTPEKSKGDKIRVLKTFSILLGRDRLLKELNQEIIENEYVPQAKAIPKRLDTIYKNPPNQKVTEILEQHLEEILRIGLSKGRESKSKDLLNREFTSIKMFLKWAENRHYVTKGLGSFIPSMAESKDKKTANPAFTENDLTLLFNSKHYIQGRLKRPSDYWMPLLGLLTGARGNELAFLFQKDIRKHPENGIWYIYIQRNRDIWKSTKSQSSIRSIPIHPQLKKLGFLNYVESVKEGSRIFPELKENVKGDYYKSWGNKFNRYEIEKKKGKPIVNKNGTVRMRRGYMTQCGVEKHVTIEDVEVKKSFKSFRHMMLNFLDRNTTPRIKNFIIGHKYENASVPDYLHPDKDDLQEAYKVLKKLTFSTIKWEEVKKREWR